MFWPTSVRKPHLFSLARKRATERRIAELKGSKLIEIDKAFGLLFAKKKVISGWWGPGLLTDSLKH